MSRVMTFSRVFPSYHPKAGQPTYFVEKIHKSMDPKNKSMAWRVDKALMPYFNFAVFSDCAPKHHTIRAGHRWKEGDWFRPVVWGNDVNPKSGRSGPYHSKQITFAPDIQVKKVWNFEIHSTDKHCHILINYREWLTSNMNDFYSLMRNDGLEPDDFRLWFQLSPEYKKRERFSGQIICWNENIEY